MQLFPDSTSVYQLFNNKSVLLDHVNVLASAAQLARDLDQRIIRDELGIPDYERALLNTLNIADDVKQNNTSSSSLSSSSSSSSSWSESAAEAVRTLADSVGRQFQLCSSVLSLAVGQTERLFKQHLQRSVNKRLAQCSQWPANQLRQSSMFGVPVDPSSPCQLSLGGPDALAFRPGVDLLEVFNASLAGGTRWLRWQYFLSADSSIVEYPAHRADQQKPSDPACSGAGGSPRHVPELVSSMAPSGFTLYLVIDSHVLSPHTSSLHLLNILRATVVGILQSLPAHAEVQLLVTAPAETHGGRVGTTIATATACRLTPAAKRRLIGGVCDLAGYNDSVALPAEISALLSTIDKCLPSCCSVVNTSADRHPTTVLVISLAHRSAHWLRLLDEKQNQNRLNMSGSVAVRLIRIVDDVSETSSDGYPDVFDVVNISSADQLDVQLLKRVLFGADVSVEDRIHYSLPHEDSLTGGTMVSMFSPCFHLDYYIGSVAVDVDIGQMIASYTEFSSEYDSYSFLVDYRFGVLVAHPALTVPPWQSSGASIADNQRRSTADPTLLHLDVSEVETQPGFAKIRDDLLRLPSGVRKVKHSPIFDEQPFSVYVWNRVQHTSYTLCTVYSWQQERQVLPRLPVHVPAGTSAAAGLLYHRLSQQLQYQSSAAQPAAPLCQHFQQLASTSSSSLYLSSRAYIASTRISATPTATPLSNTSSSFASVFSSTSSSAPDDVRCWPHVRPTLAYLSDTSRLMASPGLRRHVRDDVTLLARAAPYWRRRFFATHSTSPRVVRWYAATAAGVMVMYPGGPIHADFEPAARAWFRLARSAPGTRLILSPPRLDTGGAGFVFTVSRQVSLTALSRPVDFSAVVAADVTFGMIEQMVVSVLGDDTCRRLTCILFEQQGYVLFHSRVLNSTTAANQLLAAGSSAGAGTERLHITRLEPLLANQLLQHSTLVRKVACRRYSDMTVQRMYEFNVSPASGNHMETDLPSIGEHCKHYRVAAVPGTDLLLAVVNGSCQRPAFCPCSRTSRGCLTCPPADHQIDTHQCECPCQCPIDSEQEASFSSSVPLPPCPSVDQWGPGLLLAGQSDVCGASGDGAHWPACIDTSCEHHQRRCNASAVCDEVLGCVWCRVEEDGVSALSRPHCAAISRCFGGVRGAGVPRPVVSGTKQIPAPDRGSSNVLQLLFLCVVLTGVGVVVWRVLVWRRHRYLSNCGVEVWWRHRRHCQSPPLTLNEECEDHESVASPPPPPPPRVAGDALLLLMPLGPVGAFRQPRDVAVGSSPATSDLGYGTMTPPDTVVGEIVSRPNHTAVSQSAEKGHNSSSVEPTPTFSLS